jgi:nicotinamidase-related amidase/alkylated DNA repair dioxygenase AlkB
MLFPVGSLPNAPNLETRKALLVIDLQNDFLQEDGKLFVKNAKEFLPKLPSLVAKFREKGEIFWARTEFQETRTMTCPESESDMIVLREYPDTSRSSEANASYMAKQPQQDLQHSMQDCGGDDPEAFLGQRAKADCPRCCLPDSSGCASPKTVASMIDYRTDWTFVKTDYSAFQTTSLLPALRAKLITQLYLCGSLSNISVYATALDAVRHGLEVTVIEDCVGYRTAKRHEEAMRQMADAMGVNGTDYQELMDDLNGNLGDIVTSSTFESSIGTRQVNGDASLESYTMRVKVKRWMDNANDDKQGDDDRCNAESSGSVESSSAKRRSLNNRTGLSVSSTAKQADRPMLVAASQKRSSDRIDNEEPARSVSRSAQNAKTSRTRIRRPRKSPEPASDEAALPATVNNKDDVHEKQSRHSRQESSPTATDVIAADSDPDPVVLDEMSSLVDQAKAIGRKLRGTKESRQTGMKALGPGDFIGERDSRVIYDFLPTAENHNNDFAKLRDDGDSREVQWQKMYHCSGEVPRRVAVQGEAKSDGSIPIYRHPVDEPPALLPISPTVQSIRREVEKAIGHPVNHVLIQLYRGGEDNISEHSDKTLDIVRGSFIVNVSLGAMRTMTLRTKKSALATPASDQQRRASTPASSPRVDADVKRSTQQIPLPHNSLFVLGQHTNRVWLHAIRADKRPAAEKKAEELAFDGERISLTFRHIGTFVDPENRKIWGQGATSKTEADAKVILDGQEAEEEGERLIKAFGRENRQAHDFDWPAQYGAGFDVVDFGTKERSSAGAG